MKVLSPFVEKHRNLGKEIVHRLRERLSDLVFPLEPGDPLPQGTLPIRDPFTDEVFACVRGADKEIVFSSVEKARKAQVEFSSLPERKRGGYLTKIAEVLKRHRDLFELAEGLNVGLPKLISSRFSVSAMIRHYEYAGEWADKIYGTQVPTNDPKSLDFTLREPYGVVASLTAWNTPSLFLGSKVAYALAVGNTVLVKPSERSFLPALVFLYALQEVDLPPGVLQILFGGPEVGALLVRHPDVSLITFTGGTEIGREVAREASPKPVKLELGGKSPAIVFPDADIDTAVFSLVGGTFALSGQACAASTRILVHREIFDTFLSKFRDMAQNLSIGDPLEDSTILGPLIDSRAVERTDQYVQNALKRGAELVFGGRRLLGEDRFGAGNFYAPTLLKGVHPEDPIACEEIFGPVSVIFPFEKVEEAVDLANRTPYGLAGAVFTRDIKRALRVVKALKGGYLWINTYGVIPYTTPFGGYKSSGHGREGGLEGFLEMTQVKNVYVQL